MATARLCILVSVDGGGLGVHLISHITTLFVEHQRSLLPTVLPTVLSRFFLLNLIRPTRRVLLSF